MSLEKEKDKKIREMYLSSYKAMFDNANIDYSFSEDEFIIDSKKYYFPNDIDVNGERFQNFLKGNRNDFLVFNPSYEDLRFYRLYGPNFKIPSKITKITKIGHAALEACPFEKVKISDSVVCIGEMAFNGSDKLTQVKISDSVTTIEHSAFSHCWLLEKVKFSPSIKKIGYSAFENCSSLVKVDLNTSITTLEDEVFKNCENLQHVIISSPITAINYCAFEGCEKLEKIELPSTLKFIDLSAFDYCENIKKIIFRGTKEEWEKIEIEDVDLREIKVTFKPKITENIK